MKTISLETQGVKGGQTKKTSSLGSTATFLRHEQDYILIDDFEGFGKDYKQRELTEITIVKNGKILFQGDKYQLFEKLTKK